MPVFLCPHSDRSCGSCALHIGLIVNMADEALKATERQYVTLLEDASQGAEIHLSLYTLPGIPRAAGAATVYSDIHDLWNGQLDGLIVTGREPQAADLRQEPYWDSFTRTLAWSQENVQGTIWSCLAAHAAVFQMAGISRRRREDKLFGVFACDQVSRHPLTNETPLCIEAPHSRWNGLRAEELAQNGYTILTQTREGEVDIFVKEQKTLSIFLQGHPEYGADTLLREYRRDVSRFFRGELNAYPAMPQGYFDQRDATSLQLLQQMHAGECNASRLPEVLSAIDRMTVQNTWRFSAIRLYQNWLQLIQGQKQRAAKAVSKRITMPERVTPRVPIATDNAAQA